MVMLCIIFSFGLPCGIADLTASTVSNAVPHSQLLRNDIFRVAAATSTIDSLAHNPDESQTK
jgi:hypothetical protein